MACLRVSPGLYGLQQAQHPFKGFSLFAMDGTTLRTADGDVNRKHVGASVAVNDRLRSLPPLHLALGDLGANLQRDAHAGIRIAAGHGGDQRGAVGRRGEFFLEG